MGREENTGRCSDICGQWASMLPYVRSQDLVHPIKIGIIRETVIGAAMANDALINLLAWCQREREQLQMQREMLKAGRFRIFENDDSGPWDISNQHIEQITANIAELDRLLAEYYHVG
jgi:hypothetical protein